MVTFSIVSHGQLGLVRDAMISINKLLPSSKFIITINIPENEEILCSIPDNIKNIHILRNASPMGYGANHNQAFLKSDTQFFCVCNPDIKLNEFNFSLKDFFDKNPDTAFVSGKVYSTSNVLEDNIRDFPLFSHMIMRFFGSNKGQKTYKIGKSFDWCAGMFMVFDSSKYRELNGFDDKFFMYYEDADICRRIGNLDFKFFILDNIKLIHDARRGSRKDIKLLFMHIISALRFRIRMCLHSNNFKKGKIVRINYE
jgi:N-acetylglucosaminyl-diphospho-decaprenol L-rhamnosyltransferase